MILLFLKIIISWNTIEDSAYKRLKVTRNNHIPIYTYTGIEIQTCCWWSLASFSLQWTLGYIIKL